MRTINTLAELRAERQRLYVHKAFLEAEIRNDIAAVKEDLKPLHIAVNMVGKVLTDKNNHTLSHSVGTITNSILKDVVFRNAGWITRLVVPFLAKNVASNVTEASRPKIAGWIHDLLAKFGSKSKSKPATA